MSADPKKDDHGGGHGAKKSLGSRLAGIAVAVLLVLIFIYYLGATAPMVVDGATSVVTGTGTALTRFGQGARVLATGSRDAAYGIRTTLIEWLVIAVTILIIGAIAQLIFSAFFKKKDDAAPH